MVSPFQTENFEQTLKIKMLCDFQSVAGSRTHHEETGGQSVSVSVDVS